MNLNETRHRDKSTIFREWKYFLDFASHNFGAVSRNGGNEF